MIFKIKYILGINKKDTCPFCTYVDIDGPFCNYDGTSEITQNYKCIHFVKQDFLERVDRIYFLWRMNRENKN